MNYYDEIKTTLINNSPSTTSKEKSLICTADKFMELSSSEVKINPKANLMRLDIQKFAKDLEEKSTNHENDFAKQVDDVLAGNFDKQNNLVVSEHTPELLQQLGMKDLPITLTANKLDRIFNESGNQPGEYHGLKELVKNLPEAINNPLDIIKSHNNSYVLTTDISDNQDRSVILSIRFDGKGMVDNYKIDANVLTSAYGRNNYESFMNKHLRQGNVIWDIDRGFINQNKSDTAQGLQLSNRRTTNTNNIPQTKTDVNSDTLSTNSNMQTQENNTQPILKNHYM